MKTKKLLLGCLIALSGGVAANERLRTVAIDSFRTIAEPLLQHGDATTARFDRFYAGMVEALPPQERMARALELAINRAEGASDYVIAEAPRLRGQFQRDARLQSLIQTSQNSPLLEVRMAGMEVYLAQYGLEKTQEELERQLLMLQQNPKDYGPWALWNIGVLGARGVGRVRAYEQLLLAIQEPDARLRQAAVDALAKLGGVEVIKPLMHIARTDPEMAVRERALCGIAGSGTLHIVERYEAIPELMEIIEEPNANPQMRAWGYQALREITSFYDLPESPEPWRASLTRAKLL